MIYFKGTTDFIINGPCAITLGKFDGVHRGHQLLMNRVLGYEKQGALSCVFTLNPNQESLILTEKEQKDVIAGLGISALVKCPFVPEISTMTPDQFVRKVLLARLHARYVIVGTDFCFGYRRAGNAQFLKDRQDEYGFRVEIIEKACFQGREISSTFVREAMEKGDMELVENLLGRPYQVGGIIVHGQHLGTKMGMPTVNVIPGREKLLPVNGVYYSVSKIGDKTYRGVTNVGMKPTVGGTYRGVETYLFDCSEDLYGKEIQTELKHFERPEHRFENITQLRNQIQRDILRGREYFGE